MTGLFSDGRRRYREDPPRRMNRDREALAGDENDFSSLIGAV